MGTGSDSARASKAAKERKRADGVCMSCSHPNLAIYWLAKRQRWRASVFCLRCLNGQREAAERFEAKLRERETG